jgi:polyisoprenyl-phosphate glycosyltransferase
MANMSMDDGTATGVSAIGTQLSAAPALGSVSAVLVVDDHVPTPSTLTAWGDALAELFTDVQLIIVANGAGTPAALALEELVARVPDVTVLFLAERIDHDSANLIGLDTAIGDWVLLAQANNERAPALRDLISRLREGYQVTIAIGRDVGPQGLVYDLLAGGFFRLYQTLTGRPVLRPTPILRLYSRAAALFIAGSADGGMLLRTDIIAGGFSVFVGRYPALASDPPRSHSGLAAMSKAVRELLSATALPLRLTSTIALTSGLLSLCYSLYAMVIYLMVPDVSKGWTTLSLQISGMMFLFSMMFALMAEYVLGIYRGLAPRRRYVITREIRSPTTRHARRLNVIDAAGAFHLGMPTENAR